MNQKIEISTIFHAVRRFLARIFAGAAPRAGLDISDQAVRLLYEKRGSWQLEQVALQPGTLERGTIVNADAFASALSTLHDKASDGKQKRLAVHVSVSSAPSYIQLVSIPPVSSKELADAVQLNVQVSAPVQLTELAWGWQPLPEGRTASAVLAAWIARPTVDALVSALAEANFLPASLEPKTMSVARLVRTLAPDATKTGAYLLASLDEMGVTLAVLDKGVVRFQYARTWAEIRGARPEVAYPALDELLRREVAQVVGYYAQRGGTRVTEVLLATPVFTEEITATLADLGFEVRTLTVGNPPFPLHGYGAFGSALRGNVFGVSDDMELSLLGEQVREWLKKELALRVARFWLVVAPVSAIILLATYGLAYGFVSRLSDSLASFEGIVPPTLIAELADREARVNRFNATVAEIAAVQSNMQLRSPQLSSLLAHADKTGVTLTRVNLIAMPERSSVAGIAGGDDQLLSFKRSLEGDPTLARVLLPVTEVRSGPDGLTFSMSFEASFPPASKTSP